MLIKHVILTLCIDLQVNPKMNLNPLQIISSSLSTQLLSKIHTWLLFMVSLMHKHKGWYPLGKATYESTSIDGITSQLGLEQLIHEPTHIIGEKSSCIDLIFVSQPNLVLESGVQSSLHQKSSSANSVCKIQSQSSIFTSIWAWSMTY